MRWRDKANIGLIEEKSVGSYRVRIYTNRLAIWKNDGGRLTWEELQKVKQEIWGNRVAIEIYPSDKDVINLRHTRHLWWTEELENTVKQICKHEEFGTPSS